MNRKKYQSYLWPLLGVSGFLLLWQLLALYVVRKSWLLPSLGQTLQAFGRNLPLLLRHSQYTLLEAGLGLLLSALLALVLAGLVSLSRPLRQALYPLLLLSQMVPIVVLAPLFLIWFGYGVPPKVLVAVLICFFPMVVAAISGLDAADGETCAFYRALGMSKRQLFLKVRLPLAWPYFFSGLRVSAAYAVMGAVIGEWLGAEAGLGLLLTRAQRSYDLPLVFAAIIAIILWSALLFALVALAERRCLGWRQRINENWD